MPYEGIGLRHSAVATKAVQHGAICEEDGFVGAAFKTEQIGRFVDPDTAAATQIDVGEDFEIQLGGVHEAARAGNLDAAVVGDNVYINSADNALGVTAQGVTTGALTAGWLPVGKITEIDTTRDIVRINANVAHLLVGP